MSSIEATFQPYVHSGNIRPIMSPHPQACSPYLEMYQLSRVLDDYDLVYNRWILKSGRLAIFRFFLVLKKGDLWRFLRRICNQTTLSLPKTHNTPDTDNTSYSDTYTPLRTDTYVSSFSGSGISWFDNGHFLNRHCDLLIASLVSEQISRETEKRFDGHALTGERSVNFLIRWLPEQYIKRDADMPIERQKLTVTGTGRVYFKSHTSIFTYRFIDQFFDWLDEQNGRRGESVQQKKLGRITWPTYQHRCGYP